MGGEQLGELADRGVRQGDGVSNRSRGDRRLRRGLQDLEAVERLQRRWTHDENAAILEDPFEGGLS